MKFDVIVIGAGSAGGVLAARLSEDPSRSILLLEAGPDYPNLEQIPDDLKFGYVPNASEMGAPHNWSLTGKSSIFRTENVAVPLGKVVGGTSAINGQVFLRGVPEDYDNWSALGNDEWSFVNCLPYFRKLETDTDIRGDFHGSDGPVPVRRHKQEDWLPLQKAFHAAVTTAGYDDVYDHNDPDSTGVGPLPMSNPEGIRMSTALTYIDGSRHRLNLTTRPNVLVHRILFEGHRARGVEVESGGEMFTIDGEQIVLCAGAVASPQTLMLSGIGPAAYLEEMGLPVVRDLPGVGQNLRDHPLCAVRVKTKADFPLNPYAPRIQTVLRYTATESELRNDMQILPSPFSTPLGGNPYAEEGIRLTCIVELAKSAGEIKLRSTTAGDIPDIDCRHLSEEFDRVRMREAVRMSLGFLEQQPFNHIVDEVISPVPADVESDDALDAWMLSNVDIGQHLAGTCKMGPANDPMAVVDQYGRVHGIENLRIADASIMPDVIRANTNLTTILIGERIADWMSRLELPPADLSNSLLSESFGGHLAESDELERSLADLREAVDSANSMDISAPSDEIVEKARQILINLHEMAPRTYRVYLMPDGAIALDTRGQKPDGALIALNTDGSACCSGELKRNDWHIDYSPNDTLPDEELVNELLKIGAR